MSEQRTQGQKQQSGGSQSGGQGGSGNNPLQTERGNTTIQDSVVSQIAGIAAGEVEGIRMGGGGAASQAVSGLLGNIPGVSGGQSKSSGISVEVGQEEAAIDLTCSVEYGKSIPQLTEAVRKNVIGRIESLVGLKATEVNIDVGNIYFPQEEEQQKQEIEEKRQERQENKQENQDQRVQ